MTASIASEIQLLSPSALIELFTLDATKQGGTVFHFHAGTNQVQNDVVWQGVTYTRLPIEASGFDKRSTGALPRPVLTVSNVQGLMGAQAKQFGDFLGCKIIRKRTHARFLDSVNFPPIPLSSPAFVSRASTGTYTDAMGTIRTAAANVARYDYDPVTRNPGGLLIESASTNLLRQSSRADTAPWATDPNAGATSLTAMPAPDGTTTTVMITRDVNAGYRYQTPAVAAGAYTFSTYVKQGTAAPFLAIQIGNGFRAFYDFGKKLLAVSNGCTATSVKQKDVGDGWTRLSITATLPAGNTVCALCLSDANGSIYSAGSAVGTGHYVWGAQLEAGTAVTTLIPTTTAAVTRAADVTTMFSPGGNPEASPDQSYPDEIWFIDRKATENAMILSFELSSALDMIGVTLPRRQIVQNCCTWVYRSPECGYAGGAVAKSDDTPTTDLNQDRCSKSLAGCKKRFGDGTLPFGGFPGCGLVR